ncbi:hypothetical protein P9G84_31250 [Brevibacillus centrosporus]|uniref:hypothetical protein n=1 Tax=Brevibacillus centrosporus TaxID=54910 RepID=UPI001142D4A2|nr:hypothetical protein [Brevibacillus centrosporus]MEC2133335.1 hypothetical protein [Brevibacillus centrosporus]GED33908.1 hypothetical protein BCE02nite_50490 [Brevibacillus centrosporus]
MRKSTVGIFSALLIAALTFGITSNSEIIFAKSKGPEVYSIHADYKMFEDYKELEKYSPIIVQVKFSGERETVLPKNVGDFLPYSKTKVDVKKVIKGELEEKDEIIVLEPAALDNDRNVFLTTEGYNLIDSKGKYTLFLRPTPLKNSYQIVGMYQGKYDHSISKESKMKDDHNITFDEVEGEEVFGENVSHFNKLKKQVLKKHNWE